MEDVTSVRSNASPRTSCRSPIASIVRRQSSISPSPCYCPRHQTALLSDMTGSTRDEDDRIADPRRGHRGLQPVHPRRDRPACVHRSRQQSRGVHRRRHGDGRCADAQLRRGAAGVAHRRASEDRIRHGAVAAGQRQHQGLSRAPGERRHATSCPASWSSTRTAASTRTSKTSPVVWRSRTSWRSRRTG